MKSLKSTIFVLFTLMFLVTFSALGFITFTHLSHSTNQSASEKLSLSAQEVAQELNGWLLNKASIVSEAKDAIAFYGTEDYDLTLRYLKDRYNQHEEFVYFYMGYENSGRHLEGQGWVAPKDYDPRTRPWYKTGRDNDGAVFSSPYVDVAQDKIDVSISEKMMKGDQLVGVVGADVEIQKLVEITSNINISKHSYGILIDKDNNIIVHKESSFNPTAETFTNVADILDGQLNKILKKDTGTINEFVDYDGIKKYVAFIEIPVNGWKLGIIQPVSEVLAPLKELYKWFAIIIAVALLLVFTISYIIATRITKPIGMVRDAAEKLALGDTNVNIVAKTNDEIGQLIVSFDKMIDNIEEQSENAKSISKGNLSIEIEPKSENDVLALSMKKVVEELRKLTEESKLLTDAAIEGELIKRGNAEQFEGGFKKLIEGTNAVMNTLVGHIDKIPTPVAFIDKQFELKYVNDQAIEVVDMKREDMLGRKCYDLFCSNVCNNDQCPGRLSYSQGIIAETEATAGLAELTIKTVPYNDINGNIVGAMELLIDQTEIKNAQLVSEKQARYQKQEVEKLVINLEQLAKGNLDIKTSVAESDSDTEEIANNFRKINDNLETSTSIIKSYVNELSEVLADMAGKNFTVGIDREYLGDFIKLKKSINYILEQFNKILSEINGSAEQVEFGADQVAGSSQNLSQGAAEQAGSVVQIGATVTQVAEQTKQNATNANKANELTVEAKSDAQIGNKKMNEMLSAMDEIKESSKNISNIIKVIDEIAFQTNILALNAAVEAARAGEHGKGFAVVAEEVRNLAARSATAAKETTDLIDNSINKVDEGYKIANDTADALSKIVTGVTDTVEIVGMIADASNEQAGAIEEINQGIEQFSQVTQTNTATAEESASASEEMAGQAQLLKGLIQEFRLKNTIKKISENR